MYKTSVGTQLFKFYKIGQRNLIGNFPKWNLIRNLSTPAEPLANYSYETVSVTSPSEYVFHVEINRPDKLNTFNRGLWMEIGECFSQLEEDQNCRVVVLSGRGKMFTAGIDFSELSEMSSIVTSEEDIARKCRTLNKLINQYQNSLSSLEKCPKPVIAAINGPCIGAGVDLICSADIRYCSMDAWFQVKEVDVGLAADVGTLQRLPKIIGNSSLVRELCFSSRKFYADEAERVGFISRVFSDKNELLRSAFKMASTIAEKSPVAVQTTKEAIIHGRDHSVEEGLKFIAGRNMVFLQSEDLMKSFMALMNKEKPNFPKY